MLANCDVIVIFMIYGKFWATRNPDSRHIVCKTYIFINGNLLFYKNWKQHEKISRTTFTILSKGTISAKKCWNFAKKWKIKRALVPKGKFSETTFFVCVLIYQIWSF